MDFDYGTLYEDTESPATKKTLKEIYGSIDEASEHLVPLTEEQYKVLKPLSNRKRKKLLNGFPCVCGSGKSFKKCCKKKYVSRSKGKKDVLKR